ncbi:SDR family NAD(P)-dependent oxidoreductase [Pseudokineococcus sp. 1T1Z-3]|uniref:SDR family NAD(P)-dependent oxidoreductase n=1 Tax=Pseudokineococcus sp. 1T1Z-3 TaxID=3132745 RepID=UPI0030A80B19
MPTALITGGHGGIGREASRHLAAHYGWDLVLAGRDLPAMHFLAADLQAQHRVQVTSVEMDVASLVSVREGSQQLTAMVQAGTVGRRLRCSATRARSSAGRSGTARTGTSSPSRPTASVISS